MSIVGKSVETENVLEVVWDWGSWGEIRSDCMGFPGCSVGKESACSVGDPGFDLLSWEDPLGKGMATHSSTLARRFCGVCSPWGYRESDMTEQLSLHFASTDCWQAWSFYLRWWKCSKIVRVVAYSILKTIELYIFNGSLT